MKKKLFLLILSTLCLIVAFYMVGYTIYKSANKPETKEISIAMVVGDENLALVLPSKYELKVNNEGEAVIIEYNEDTHTISAKNAGKAEIVVESSKENLKTTYNITVWNVGTGTSEDPYNVTKAEHITRQSENYGSGKYFVMRSDIDLSSYSNWNPIGKIDAPFASNFDGNNFTIRGLRVNATYANSTDFQTHFDEKYQVRIGFFGTVEGTVDNKVTIKDVNMDDVIINTRDYGASLLGKTEIMNNLSNAYVAPLMAYGKYVNVIGSGNIIKATVVSSLSNSMKTNNNYISALGGVSGAIGYISNGTFDGYNIICDIDATDVSFHLEDDAETDYGARVAGAVISLSKSIMKNCTVTGSLKAKNYQNSTVAGIVSYVKSDSVLQDTTAVNMNLVGLSSTLSETGVTQKLRISGAVDYNEFYDNLGEEEQGKIKNVHVNNLFIDAALCGQAAGFVGINYGIINNCSANGNIYAYSSAGFAYANGNASNKGTILAYDSEEHTKYAATIADFTINIKEIGAGLVNINQGTIEGSEGNIPMINVVSVINFNNSKLTYKASGAGETLADKYISAGLIATNNTTSAVSGFRINSTINGCVNAAGVIGNLQSGTINNITGLTSINTFDGTKGDVTENDGTFSVSTSGMTQNVGGIVVNSFVDDSAQASGSLSDININVSVNKGLTATEKTANNYSLNNFGGIGAVLSNNLKYNKIVVVVDVYADYSEANVSHAVNAAEIFASKAEEGYTATSTDTEDGTTSDFTGTINGVNI